MSRFLTQEEVIRRFRKAHGDRYDYSRVEYTSSNDKVEIICKKHGAFWQKPVYHTSGRGCQICGREKVVSARRLALDELIIRFHKAHGEHYDYSRVKYEGVHKKVIIGCPEHGWFQQKANDHLWGKGCGKCANNLQRTNAAFVADAKMIHGNRYDYSLVEYTNNKTSVVILCRDHGAFTQAPSDHLCGAGCSLCGASRGEESVRTFLVREGVIFVPQKSIRGLRSNGKKLRFDFYLPEYGLMIEYQGRQHYGPVDFFGGEAAFVSQKKRDQKKRDFIAKRSDLRLLEIKYTDKERIPEILTKELGLSNRILRQLTLF